MATEIRWYLCPLGSNRQGDPKGVKDPDSWINSAGGLVVTIPLVGNVYSLVRITADSTALDRLERPQAPSGFFRLSRVAGLTWATIPQVVKTFIITNWPEVAAVMQPSDTILDLVKRLLFLSGQPTELGSYFQVVADSQASES